LIENVCKDFCIIEEIKNVAHGGKTSHPYDIRDSAKRVYEEWTGSVEEVRGFPCWKMIDPSGLGVVEYVLQG